MSPQKGARAYGFVKRHLGGKSPGTIQNSVSTGDSKGSEVQRFDGGKYRGRTTDSGDAAKKGDP